MRNYSVDDGHGNNVAQGLTVERARTIAQEHANKTGLACLVYTDGTDAADEVVEPEAKGGAK